MDRWYKYSEKSQKWAPKVRYFGCGEYGGNTKRPHYHIILFNVPNSFYKKDPIHRKEYSMEIEKIWKKGSVDIGNVERGSVHYVTKYHLFPLVMEWDEKEERERPFALMSRKPGIGINYINDEFRNYINSTKNSYATLKDGIKQPLGKYYKEKIKEELSEESIREMRRRSAEFIIEAEKREREAFDSEADFLRSKREQIKGSNRKLKNQLKKNNKI